MTEQQPAAGEDEIIRVDQTDRRSAVPFVAAAVVAVIVLIAVVLGGVLSPAEKNVTDADRLTAAVRDFVDGSNRSAAVPPPGTACQGFDASRSPLAGQDGAGKPVEITKIDQPMVDGDRGKATVTTKVGGQEKTTTWNLTRSGDKWLVCT
ncbi:Rv0361 family membrane protein [Nocardia sp. R7R-8]|uniref:Rv0361 family membrane protein n=1 Tax=Nocardia sp. R7R-8 TaxID=3459304 RepID=UPI00403D595E